MYQQNNPACNISLSPLSGKKDEVETMLVEDNSIPMKNIPIPSLTSVKPPSKYLGTPECKTPLLVPTNSLVFDNEMKNNIMKFKDKSRSENERTSTQRLIERTLVEKASCSNLNSSIMKDYRLRMFNLDIEMLDSELSSEKALNANLHENLACAVDSIVYDGKLPGMFTPSMRERARNWLPTVKQIGAESVEGYALKTSLTPDTNLFVMKAPRNPKDDSLVHEALVGLYALNKIRHILPNFMYVYGYTTCSPPALENKEVLTWCSSSSPAVSYLITENIRDAVTISDFVSDNNIDGWDLLSVMYQVFNALNVAFKMYGYTHYDLHYGNIMVRKYSRTIAIPFFDSNGDISGYIPTIYVPYIIDYGYSTINIGGVGFGKQGLEWAHIDSKPFPMYDVYKILCFLGESILRSYTPQSQHHPDKFRILDKMFEFFGNGPLKPRVDKRRNDRSDYYAADPSYLPITHDQFISWLRLSSGIPDIVQPNILPLLAKGVLTAPINTSLDTCAFYDAIASNAGPESSLEYCEAVAAIKEDTRLDDKVKEESISWLNDNFDAEDYYDRALPNVRDRYIVIRQLINDNKLYGDNMIPNISTESNLATPAFIQKYKKHITDFLKVKDFMSEFLSFYKSSVCSLANQDKYESKKHALSNIEDAVTIGLKIVSNNRLILHENLKYAKTIDWSSLSTSRDVRKFWQTEHDNLVLAS